MTSIAAEPPIELGAVWRRVRYPVILVVIGLALVSLFAALGTTPYNQSLDPRNTDPDGAHALAALLRDRGIDVSIVSSLAAIASDPNTGVLVTEPDVLPDRVLATIARSTSPLVLVNPSTSALAAAGLDLRVDTSIAASTLPPDCPLRAAATAGSARIAGDLYAVRPGSTAITCYHDQGDAALVETIRPNGASTIVLGSGSTLSNAELADQGDAALALGVLDTRAVQWVPGGLGAGPAPPSRQGLLNLLPPRLLWATLELFIALVVLALWRARRLGRAVVEPLPAVVRAAETVEGAGRMLHAAHASGTAASALRSASIARLSRMLRLAPDDAPAAVTSLVAQRAGLADHEVGKVLYGGEPRDDAELVRLAQELARLEALVVVEDVPREGGQQ
ncbi:MAG TPA: DUF4350 domain-containing protein [Mycobacteriales bacterium]|nr:DUF4350 domain-containing protein [Mycobacteriales bacterium]